MTECIYKRGLAVFLWYYRPRFTRIPAFADTQNNK